MNDPKDWTGEVSVRDARRALGLRDENGVIKLKDRSPEALLVTIDLLQKAQVDSNQAHAAAMLAMEKRLKAARKAKHLANARADKAMKAARDFIDAFSEAEK